MLFRIVLGFLLTSRMSFFDNKTSLLPICKVSPRSNIVCCSKLYSDFLSLARHLSLIARRFSLDSRSRVCCRAFLTSRKTLPYQRLTRYTFRHCCEWFCILLNTGLSLLPSCKVNPWLSMGCYSELYLDLSWPTKCFSLTTEHLFSKARVEIVGFVQKKIWLMNCCL